MLPPEEFGKYLAIGTKKRQSKQEALFFELDMDKLKKIFDLSDINERCVPHQDGEPKHSVYYSIYRVLERVPLDSIKNIYLVTRRGMVLKIEKTSDVPSFHQPCYLYQEIVPVHPRIVSSLDPYKFAKFITDKKNNLFVPKICFVDLRLGELAHNPETGSIFNLPYSQIDNLKDCLSQVKNDPQKQIKTVNRTQQQHLIYRTIDKGFFIGEGDNILFFPFPSEKELNTRYYDWWRSAMD
jgi:hypothetical protein